MSVQHLENSCLLKTSSFEGINEAHDEDQSAFRRHVPYQHHRSISRTGNGRMNLDVVIENDIDNQYRNGQLLLPDGTRFGYTLEWPTIGGKFIPVPFGIHELYVAWSNKFKKLMPHISVDGRAGIEIHGGNRPNDSEGCTLLGKVRAAPDVIAEHETDELIALLQKTAIQIPHPDTELTQAVWGGHTITYRMAA